MASFTYATRRYAQSRVIRRPITRGYSAAMPMVHLGVWALIVLLGLTYVVQTNKQTTLGYELQQLEDRLAQVQNETRDLELQARRLQSVESVRERLGHVELVDVTNPEYFASGSVARAR